MSQVNCQVEIPQHEGESSAELTVGREFLLHCRAEASTEWPKLKPDQVELRLEQADQYKLKLLEFRADSSTDATIKVTSYKAGQHQIKKAQLVDPEHSVVLSDLDFTVNSVIDPKEPPAEPYGPFGPLSLSLPIWYSLSVILIILAVIFTVVWRWRRRQHRKKLLAAMRLEQYAQDPLAQFFQVVRRAQRKYGFFVETEAQSEEVKEFVQELGDAYKIYLARHLLVPTLSWSERRILSDIKKNHPEFYSEFSPSLKKTLAEVERAGNHAQLTAKDCQQLLDLLRKQVDQMESYFRKVED